MSDFTNPLPAASYPHGPATSVEAWHIRHELITALAALPPRQRQVMPWTFSGYTPAETATSTWAAQSAKCGLLLDGYLDRVDDVLATRLNGTREPDAIVRAMEVLQLSITDFTGADLAGLDLRGVRWSVLTTRWPPEWADVVREASVPVDPDHRPDLYEVGDDPRVRHAMW